MSCKLLNNRLEICIDNNITYITFGLLDRFIEINKECMLNFVLGYSDDCLLEMVTTAGSFTFGINNNMFVIFIILNSIGSYSIKHELTITLQHSFKQCVSQLIQLTKKL